MIPVLSFPDIRLATQRNVECVFFLQKYFFTICDLTIVKFAVGKNLELQYGDVLTFPT